MEGLGYGMPQTMSVLRRFATPLRNLCPHSLPSGRQAIGGNAHARTGILLRGPLVRSQATAVETQQEAAQTPPAPSAQVSAQTLQRNLDAPTFQEAVIRLQNYWAKFGCAICQPHNTEVRTRSPVLAGGLDGAQGNPPGPGPWALPNLSFVWLWSPSMSRDITKCSFSFLGHCNSCARNDLFWRRVWWHWW